MSASPFQQDYFTLFGLPMQYNVDLGALSSRYHELQRTAHPDRFAGGAEHERRLSVQYAALFNEAFQVLRHPVRRAQYMLGLRGIGLDQDHATVHDPAFLMEQITLREQLDECITADALQGVVDTLNAQLTAATAAFAAAFAREEFTAARGLFQQMQFLDRVGNEAEERLAAQS